MADTRTPDQIAADDKAAEAKIIADKAIADKAAEDKRITDIAAATGKTVDQVIADENREGGVQKKINKLTRERREAREEAIYYKGLAEGKATVTPQAATTADEGGGSGDDELDPNDFDSDADFLRAVADKTRKEIKADSAKEKRDKENASTQDIISKQYQGARVKHEDFDEIALNPEIQVTRSMFDAAMGESLGEILYHLGKNPDEARRISILPPMQQIKEIGKIETKLTITIKKKDTNTPNPPIIVGGGGGSPPLKREEDMNREELHASWNKTRREEAGV